MVSGGETSGYGLLKVKEQLWLFSQLYGLPSGQARMRINQLLERLGLADAAERRVSSLSSGMRQKMNLIRGLVSDPRILFLDEPTVALDVGAARDVREEVQRWMAEDPMRSVILTTHYMMEADELCDRVAIVNRGRIVAEGTPSELKQRVKENVIIELTVGRGDPLLPALRALDGVTAASAQERDGADQLSVILTDDAVLPRVLTTVERSGRALQGVQKREPSLEDAFVKLVGRSMAEEEGET
jgi:ABC-2 type transport system ATP-binding protein